MTKSICRSILSRKKQPVSKNIAAVFTLDSRNLLLRNVVAKSCKWEDDSTRMHARIRAVYTVNTFIKDLNLSSKDILNKPLLCPHRFQGLNNRGLIKKATTIVLSLFVGFCKPLRLPCEPHFPNEPFPWQMYHAMLRMKMRKNCRVASDFRDQVSITCPSSGGSFTFGSMVSQCLQLLRETVNFISQGRTMAIRRCSTG